jgi:hypothetical protein
MFLKYIIVDGFQYYIPIIMLVLIAKTGGGGDYFSVLVEDKLTDGFYG